MTGWAVMVGKTRRPRLDKEENFLYKGQHHCLGPKANECAKSCEQPKKGGRGKKMVPLEVYRALSRSDLKGLKGSTYVRGESQTGGGETVRGGGNPKRLFL